MSTSESMTTDLCTVTPSQKQSKRVPAALSAGFRDYSATEVSAGDHMISTIKKVYERFGFGPLETPAVEFMDTLLGFDQGDDV